MRRFALFALIPAISITNAAMAQPVDNSANISVVGQHTAAIRNGEAATRWSSKDGAVYTDLGLAYLRAGRLADAGAAYRRALTLDNVVLTTRTGDDIWSHQVARHALTRYVGLTR